MMMKSMYLDDSTMSNLTSASNEAASAASLSSSSNKNEVGTSMYHPPPPPHSFANSVPINYSNNPTTQTNKKKRNLPGNPDPEAEVIAMSPKTLMATNRFVCEICNKGFQRDQNLQLHRRGHNLPWKLKQRSKTEVVRKKVYICPEPSCVHHEPSRALGDLTGIKKHFSRKHGEKKWKCDKCSKRYAVQSDWKAHSKICGTREYRCDCGTLFSRRDSFITHRAFCGALAVETARRSSSSSSHLLSPNNHLPLHLPLNFPLKPEPQHIFQHSQLNSHTTMNNNNNNNVLQQNHQFLPSWFVHNHPQQNLNNNNNNNNGNNDNNNNNNNNIHHHHHLPSPPRLHMSATALLQKAAQMGVTMTKSVASTTTNTAIVMSQQEQQQQLQQSILNGTHQHDHMCAPTTLLTAHHHDSAGPGNLSSGGDEDQQGMFGLSSGSNAFQEAYNGMLCSSTKSIPGGAFHEPFFPCTSASTETSLNPNTGGSGGGNELTIDFLGITGFQPNDQHFLSMAGLDHLGTSSPYHHQQQDSNQNQNQLPWNG